MLIQARVRSATTIAQDVRCYELVAADQSPLPAYDPGAHIDLHLPSGAIRQYSLLGGADAHYEIAIQQALAGKGGSVEAFNVLVPGASVRISNPRNNFALALGATKHLFIAGGIGITPIMAMVRAVSRVREPFYLIYCTRSPARTAFLDFARGLAAQGQAQLHHDEGRSEAQLDVRAVLAEQPEGTHVYCCGPEGMMAAVREAAVGWKAGAVHFEHFSNPQIATRQASGNASFKVRLLRSGGTFDVPADRTIIEVLRDNGIEVQTSCESGLCGTCRTRYVSGTPDHRDLILDDREHGDYMMICCSRSHSGLLTLDL
jgi:ferredoxin-NADP reductase